MVTYDSVSSINENAPRVTAPNPKDNKDPIIERLASYISLSKIIFLVSTSLSSFFILNTPPKDLLNVIIAYSMKNVNINPKICIDKSEKMNNKNKDFFNNDVETTNSFYNNFIKNWIILFATKRQEEPIFRKSTCIWNCCMI